MPKKLHLDQQTWEVMESCRSGTDDLTDPAMSRLADEIKANPELEKVFIRIEQLDIKIGAAFHDVPVPMDLAQKLWDRLAQSGVEEQVTKALDDRLAKSSASDLVLCHPACGVRKVSRRWLYLAVGVISAAVVMFVALWLNSYNTGNYTEQTVLDDAIRFFDGDTVGGGYLLAEKSPPKNFLFSHSVFFSQDTRWREIHDFLGRRGIAYDLPTRDGVRATLYVVEQNVEGLGSEPRIHPFTTGGYSSSVWQEGELLYVLVVQGEPGRYQQFLDLPRGPVA
jgi:hypothetical protein